MPQPSPSARRSPPACTRPGAHGGTHRARGARSAPGGGSYRGRGSSRHGSPARRACAPRQPAGRPGCRACAPRAEARSRSPRASPSRRSRMRRAPRSTPRRPPARCAAAPTRRASGSRRRPSGSPWHASATFLTCTCARYGPSSWKAASVSSWPSMTRLPRSWMTPTCSGRGRRRSRNAAEADGVMVVWCSSTSAFTPWSRGALGRPLEVGARAREQLAVVARAAARHGDPHLAARRARAVAASIRSTFAWSSHARVAAEPGELEAGLPGDPRDLVERVLQAGRAARSPGCPPRTRAGRPAPGR